MSIPFLAAVALLALSPLPSAQEDLVLGSGDTLEGDLVVASLTVPAGVTALVTGDLHLVALGDIRVLGTLQVVDRPQDSTEVLAGHSLFLTALGDLVLEGSVLGGAGSSPLGLGLEAAVGIGGGAGSSITLVADGLLDDGQVVAGPGGASGPLVKGGTGGSVRVFAKRRLESSDPDPAARIVGGAGGAAGPARGHRSGGAGGDSGGVEVRLLGGARSCPGAEVRAPAVRPGRAGDRARGARARGRCGRRAARRGPLPGRGRGRACASRRPGGPRWRARPRTAAARGPGRG